MKRLLGGLLAVVMSGILLTGCGNAKEKEAEKTLHEMNVEMFVTLGEYKNLEVSVAPITVEEADVDAVANDVYVSNITKEYGGITDRAVALGDTVIIDYEGKKDGIAFQGGTAQGASLGIGSGQFIDGFETGLVGVMPGETVDLNLSFPENYENEDLAGQPVVFTVTVQYIVPAQVAREDMLDEVVRQMNLDDAGTVDELYQAAYEYLYSVAENDYNMEVENQILEKLVEACEFQEIPDQFKESYRTRITQSLQQSASYYGVDLGTFTNMAYGLSSEEAVEKYSEITMKQELALQAVANAENKKISDEDLDARILVWAQEAGYSTIEEYIGTLSKEEYRNYFMSRDVIDFLVENATITEK